MRLIDADTLKYMLQAISYDDWNQGVSTTWANAYAEFADMVEDMPTIEPERKTGKWIRHCKLGVWECDQCGTQFKFPFKHHYYCPNCGADMRGEQE